MRSLSFWAVFVILVLAVAGMAQNSKESKNQSSSKQQPQTAPNMMEQCKSMMAMNQKMQADMKAMDDELDRLVTAMNAAPEGKKKADAMAALINKMVEQRKAMRETIMSMQAKDLQHMEEHAQIGKESMESCPMMKGMKGK